MAVTIVRRFSFFVVITVSGVVPPWCVAVVERLVNLSVKPWREKTAETVTANFDVHRCSSPSSANHRPHCGTTLRRGECRGTPWHRVRGRAR